MHRTSEGLLSSANRTLHQVKVASLAVATAAACVWTSAAPAALVLDLQNGAIVIPDNSGSDSDPAVGSIINNSLVAGFGIAITIAQSNSPGSPTAGLLQVTSLDVQNFNPSQATLMIRVSDTNFTLPGNPGDPMNLESSVGGTFTQASVANGDNVVFQSFADPANAQPATAVPTAALAFFKSNPLLTTESFSGITSTGFVRGGPYSLANITTVTLSPNAQMNVAGTTTATVVPEPMTGAALLGLGLLARRRR